MPWSGLRRQRLARGGGADRQPDVGARNLGCPRPAWALARKILQRVVLNPGTVTGVQRPAIIENDTKSLPDFPDYTRAANAGPSPCDSDSTRGPIPTEPTYLLFLNAK